MLGKTHAVVGIAAGLFIFPPNNIRDLVLGAGTCALGALISDIDVETSKSHRDANMVCGLAVISVLSVVILEKIFKLGIYDSLMKNSSVARIIAGMLAFIVICAFGKEQPHRSFMHSFLALILLGGCITVVFPAMLPWFAAGFLSHLITDFFNFKGVMLFYPWKKGFCLKVCHAHGFANDILFAAGSVCAVGVVGYGLFRVLHG